MKQNTATVPFTSYQKFIIFILAATQFSVVLDFMVMSPLGDLMMKTIGLTTKQFGFAVSAYAFSAGTSGLLTAGFADKYDRKKLLLFFYGGFTLGTLLCSVANTYPLLIAARIVTGIFGGVIASISMAIVGDLFDIHHRGRVMGFIQMGFGASQVLGIPISMKIAYTLGWQAPFIAIAIFAGLVFTAIALRMLPVIGHLAVKSDKNPLNHLLHTIANRDYRIGFLAMSILAVGGFMMMPFGTAFAVNNLHIQSKDLFMLFMVSGCVSLVAMPLVGKVADKIDKFTLFAIGAVWMMIVVVLYTHLGTTPLWEVMIFNILMMMGIIGRMIPAGALSTSLPNMQDRGAFMSISSSIQQMAGGLAAITAGMIVVQHTPKSPLEHYDTVGYIMVGISILSILLIYRVSVLVKKKLAEKTL